MKLKNQEILDLHTALQSVSHLQGAKFAYAVARNIAKVKTEVHSLSKAYEASEPFLEYDKQRAELCKKHAVIKDGEPEVYMVNGQSNYRIKDEKAFNEDFEKLKADHREVIEAREEQMKDFQSLLAEETEIDLYTIPHSLVPENITVGELTSIMAMITEEKESNSTEGN